MTMIGVWDESLLPVLLCCHEIQNVQVASTDAAYLLSLRTSEVVSCKQSPHLHAGRLLSAVVSAGTGFAYKQPQVVLGVPVVLIITDCRQSLVHSSLSAGESMWLDSSCCVS